MKIFSFAAASLVLVVAACAPAADDRQSPEAANRRGVKSSVKRGTIVKPMVFASRSRAGAPAAGPKLDDATALKQAKALAMKIIITDGHIDLPYRLHGGLDQKGQVTEDVSQRTEKGDFDFVRAKEGGLDAPFMSIYTPAKHETYEAVGKPTFHGSKKLAAELIDLVEALVKKNPDKFVLATSVQDVRDAHQAGKIALPLGMENGSPIEGDLKNVAHFYDRGIRYITLAHSKDNHLSDSSYDDRHLNGGLTPFGKKVIAEMNRLGIFVDVSHLSDEAVAQAIQTSAVPVIASHSSCRHFTPDFERNLSDDLIKQVAQKGGVVMINFGSTFLDDKLRRAGTARWEAWEKMSGLKKYAGEAGKKKAKKAYYAKHPVGVTTVEKVADHIEHVIKLVGVDHVGFGSDFDGVGDSLPEGLKDVSFFPNLLRVLLQRGYSEADLTKIAGENTLRVWEQIETYAKAQGG